jgi:hypothetical protein
MDFREPLHPQAQWYCVSRNSFTRDMISVADAPRSHGTSAGSVRTLISTIQLASVDLLSPWELKFPMS